MFWIIYHLHKLCIFYQSLQTLWMTSVASAPLPLIRGNKPGIILSETRTGQSTSLQMQASKKWQVDHFPSALQEGQIWEIQQECTHFIWAKLFTVSSSLYLSYLTFPFPFFQSGALPSSLLLSNTLSYFLSPTSPPLRFQTENVRWANAIHSLTKGKLGLLLRGSDRLVPEARFSFSLNPSRLLQRSVSFISFALIHTLTHSQS